MIVGTNTPKEQFQKFARGFTVFGEPLFYCRDCVTENHLHRKLLLQSVNKTNLQNKQCSSCKRVYKGNEWKEVT